MFTNQDAVETVELIKTTSIALGHLAQKIRQLLAEEISSPDVFGVSRCCREKIGRLLK